MLRLALVGCGWHSEGAHARPLTRYAADHPGELDLVAACDLDVARASRFCSEYGFARAYTDLAAMLDAQKPDAVAAIVPIEQTPHVGELLLRRGIPCVLEKPPGPTLAAAERLAETARETGTPHMVSMNRRFSPYLARAVGWAAQLGPIRFIGAQMLRSDRREDEFLWGTGVHVVDAVCSIGGALSAAHVALVPGLAADGTPWYAARLQFASGCRARVEILPTAGAVDEVFELSGDGFHARVRTMGPAGESARGWRGGALAFEQCADAAEPLYARDGSYEETASLVRSLRDRTPLHPTLAEVLPALRVCSSAFGAWP